MAELVPVFVAVFVAVVSVVVVTVVVPVAVCAPVPLICACALNSLLVSAASITVLLFLEV